MTIVYWLKHGVAGLVLVAGSTVALGGTAAEAAHFGTACQRDFQYGWLDTLPYTWHRCGRFNNELDDTDKKIFYYNLHGAKRYWEKSRDQKMLDKVDLFYSSTHGGGWSNKSVWSMWNWKTRAESTRMRLGDESRGLSIFATYACGTLKFSDGKMWRRMGPIMRGGLRYAAGSHGTLYDSRATAGVGQAFADYLQRGRTIKYAWKNANTGGRWIDNDITVMATGRTKADCRKRRDKMTWRNFSSYPRLRNSKNKWYCYTYWNNL